MTDTHINHNSGRLDWLAVVTCAGALAFVQWLLNSDIVQEPETQNLIKYILVDLACFSGALLIARNAFGSSLNRLLRCSSVGLLGAITSTLLIDLPFFYRDMPNWNGDTAGWFMHAGIFMLLNTLIAVLAMTLVCGAGFIFTASLDVSAAPNKRLERTRR